jgi:hypothetical protein
MKARLRPVPHWAFGAVAFLPLKITPNHIANSDVLAWSLLGVLAFTLALVSACAFGIYRHCRRGRQASPVTELLEEIQRQEPSPRAPAPPRPRASSHPWERPADWWQNPPQD